MPNSTPEHPYELTIQQLNAIDLLASGVGVVKTSEALGINRHTLKRWRTKNPFFISELNAKRKELWSDAQERLRGMVTKAIDVMESALNSSDSKIAVEVLKATNIYGYISGPRGSTSADGIMTEMAEKYAKELLYGHPSGDPQSQALYATTMLPILTAEVFHEMKDNIGQYIGEDEDEQEHQEETDGNESNCTK